METGIARQIIAQAKADETYEGPMPDDDDKIIAEAERIVELACDAFRQDVRGPEVVGLLRLYYPEWDGTGELPVAAGNGTGDTEAVPVPETSEAVEDEPVDPALTATLDVANQEPWEGYRTDSVATIKEALIAAPNDPDIGDLNSFYAAVWAYETAHKKRPTILKRLDEIVLASHSGHNGAGEPAQVPPEAPQAPAEAQDAPAEAEAPAEVSAQPDEAPVTAPPHQAGAIDYSDLVSDVEAAVARERLHLPQPPTEDAPILPFDYSQISDGELKALHSTFSAYAYYADFQLMKHERIAAAARQRADEMAVELLAAAAKSDEAGRERKVTFIEAEIEATPAVAGLRVIQRRHEIFAQAHRRERDSYYKLVESMSRLESMRHQEWQRSAQR